VIYTLDISRMLSGNAIYALDMSCMCRMSYMRQIYHVCVGECDIYARYVVYVSRNAIYALDMRDACRERRYVSNMRTACESTMCLLRICRCEYSPERV
jgi:hypothetical protein